MTADTIHKCDYHCDIPEHIKAQRDALRGRIENAPLELVGESITCDFGMVMCSNELIGKRVRLLGEDET